MPENLVVKDHYHKPESHSAKFHCLFLRAMTSLNSLSLKFSLSFYDSKLLLKIDRGGAVAQAGLELS